MRGTFLLLPLLAGVAVVPAQAQSVTGRAEVKVGYDEPRGTIKVFTNESADYGKGGIGYGAEIGGDAHFGGALAGVYGGIDLSDADGCKARILSNDPADEGCIRSKQNIYAGVRLGATVSDSGLVYIKGGYSHAKFRASYTSEIDTFRPGITEEFAGSGSASGWHVGAGFEVNVTHAVYVKGEYVYTRYGKALNSVIDAMEGCDGTNAHCSFRPTRQQLMFGVGFRFGGEAAAPPPPPPPPPAAAPATQTCPDGSVIEATSTCPVPPPPPAPPATSGERG